MATPSSSPGHGPTRMLAAMGVGAFAVICCAAFPLVVGLLGGLSVAGVLGVGGGLLAGAAAVSLAFVVLWARHRRAGDTSDRGISAPTSTVGKR